VNPGARRYRPRALGGVAGSVHALLLGALLLLSLQPGAASAGSASLRADGTRFRLLLPDGRVLHSAELIGAELRSADARSIVRIDAVEQGADARGQPLWLHRMSQRDATGEWFELCTPDADGARLAMVVPGRERRDGTVAADPTRYAIACTAGAQAKCLRAGYRPWQAGQRARYNACIRMIRADYGGDGRAHTEEGRAVDIYDDAGVQQPEMRPEHDFEAGWSAAGAVCVRHVRVNEKFSLAALQARYPRLRGRLGAVCTEAFARRHGALLFNRSHSPGSGARP
jgi:hypothetical protein